MSELKRCPFCQGEPESKPGMDLEEDVYLYATYCPKCDTGLIDDDIWNSRPIEDELQECIDKLEADNARLRKENSEIKDYIKGFEPFKTWSEEAKDD